MKNRGITAVVVLATTWALAAPVASAQVPPPTTDLPREECERRDQWGECIVEVPVPVGVNDPGDSPEDGASEGGLGGPAARPVCPWVTVPAGAATEENLRALFPDAPLDAVLQVRDCSDANPSTPGGTQFGLGARWVPGTAPAPAPPPASAVALMLYARVKALMEAPQVGMSPPPGAPAVVDVPVFVAVENWQGQLQDSDCVLGVCVDITASPSLEFTPGEPQAPVIQCDPPGSRYDPAAGDAMVQASVPGACAYAYQSRSGVAARPAQWPGLVTVRWAVSWTANTGATGSFPDLTFPAPVPRAVDEVQTVVAEHA